MENRKTPAYIGENYFDFDVGYELIIYKYLCNRYLKNKELKKLNDKHKFITYIQWKDYIANKYKLYKDDMLIEFIHYLNQKIRNEDSGYEDYKIIIPVLLTVLSDKLYEQIIQMSKVEMNTLLYMFNEFVFVLLVICIYFFCIKKIFDPMLDKSFEKNFYLDYKKEIEEILIEHNPNIQI
jgi:hypothetical protein